MGMVKARPFLTDRSNTTKEAAKTYPIPISYWHGLSPSCRTVKLLPRPRRVIVPYHARLYFRHTLTRLGP